ncbi:MAG: M20 family metallopeptidase [Nitrososphaeria archaeon]
MNEKDLVSARSKELLKSLIKIPSINPFKPGGKGEKEIVQFIYEELKSHEIKVELQEVEEGRSNVIATLEGKEKGPVLILNGHIDTVGVENMQIEPFAAYEDQSGNVYGRGASDMKGGVAAMMAAVESVAEVQDKIKGKILFSAVVDEEYLGKGTAKFAEKYSGNAAVVAEPTELKLGIAHKGMVWFRVMAKGRAAHGSVPELGVDAIRMMCHFINAMYSYSFKRSHPLLGSPRIHASMIEGGSEWSKVPDTCVLSAERRILPGESWESVRDELNEIITGLRNSGINFEGSIELVNEFPPLETDPKQYIVTKLSEAVKEAKGIEPQLVGLTYWTDGATLAKKGIPTVIFGPGSISVAHAPVEYVNAEEVAFAAMAFRQLILSWGT